MVEKIKVILGGSFVHLSTLDIISLFVPSASQAATATSTATAFFSPKSPIHRHQDHLFFKPITSPFPLSHTHARQNATASNKNTRLSSTSASYISLEANQVPSTMNRPSAAFSPPSGPVPHTQRYNHTSPHNSHRRGYCRPKCAPRSTRPWRRLLWYCS
jgi:hypothetical protein